jgi:hypothetical protein
MKHGEPANIINSNANDASILVPLPPPSKEPRPNQDDIRHSDFLNPNKENTIPRQERKESFVFTIVDPTSGEELNPKSISTEASQPKPVELLVIIPENEAEIAYPNNSIIIESMKRPKELISNPENGLVLYRTSVALFGSFASTLKRSIPRKSTVASISDANGVPISIWRKSTVGSANEGNENHIIVTETGLSVRRKSTVGTNINQPALNQTKLNENENIIESHGQHKYTSTSCSNHNEFRIEVQGHRKSISGSSSITTDLRKSIAANSIRASINSSQPTPYIQTFPDPFQPSIQIQNILHSQRSSLNERSHTLKFKIEKHPDISTIIIMVIYSYIPEKSDEILIQSADKLKIIHLFKDGWCLGRNITTDKVGVFPVEYIYINRVLRDGGWILEHEALSAISDVSFAQTPTNMIKPFTGFGY